MGVRALLAVCFCLAACGPAAQSPLSEAEASGPMNLSAAGYGPVEIGMGVEGARALLGATRVSEIVAFDDPPCALWHVRSLSGGDGVILMARGGLITRVSDYEGQDTVTPEGVGIGSSEADVRAAYPNAEERPAPYDPAGRDLVVWAQPEQSGVRFELDAAGQVKAVHGGDSTILLAEGCLLRASED